MWFVIGLVVIVVIVGLVVMVMYNRLVKLRNRCDSGWSAIDVQLRRRYDLIPNLVETVKGYAKHEQGTLSAVIQARQAGIDANSVEAQGKAENMLTGALNKLFALSEAYPDLKADANFRSLQEEITSTEDKVAYARQYYNAAVLAYRNALETVPTNFVANSFGFKPRDYFEISEPEARGPVQVSF
ncbi:MAG: LemA family protein [Actinobacteria bacterium]|nr:LemA family protein [Actinomycetota bacterium]MCB9388667.1 LemA family protein [Acidimicrobiia bacterium]